MKTGPLTLPLIATSGLFFYVWVMYAWLSLHISSRSYELDSLWTVMIPLSLISLGGTVMCLKTIRHESPRWYRGIPLAAVCAVYALWMGVVRWIVPGSDPLSYLFLFLLAPATAMFLYAFPDDYLGTIRVPAAVFVSLISAVSLSSAVPFVLTPDALPAYPIFSALFVAGFIYTVFLMPIIGVLLIWLGVRCR